MDAQDLQRIKNKFDIVGNDSSLNRAIETAVAVAPTDLTVLIAGESGVGKEVLPQIIHQYSKRRTGKYLAVNCGGIPEGTVNAELFGHEKGAFTGAIGERKGYFEEANGGTLFLDEIGELPKDTQALLLRVLQNGEYIKVGSSKVEKTDVRIIAATNVNLAYAVATGKFREDLYYRLTGIQISMPSLRDRNRDDVYLLFRKFSSDIAEKYHMPPITLTEDAREHLMAYPWYGNIRELKNVTEQIAVVETERTISRAILMNYLNYVPEEKMPALIVNPAQGGTTAISDRELLLKALSMGQMINEMRQELNELRQAVAQMTQGMPLSTMSNIPTPPANYHLISDSNIAADTSLHVIHPDKNDAAIEDFLDSEVLEEESLALEEREKRAIIQALERHKGKRNLAAKELHISERTLYRKIKEYDIEK